MSSTNPPDHERPRRHPGSAYRAIGDEGGLVVLPGRAEVKVLNPVGTRVFALLDGSRTIEEIVQVVCDEFEVSAEEAMSGVVAFVDELGRHGMLADPSVEQQEVPR